MEFYESLDVSLSDIVINLGLSAAMAFALSMIYVKYGTALSNRRSFSRNFFILSMTITLIIGIVKSSLALSLGLVGALSIVRFRAAIKEPEELAYLFIAIAIGLGLGANMNVLTGVSFCVICLVIILHSYVQNVFFGKKNEIYNVVINFPKKGEDDDVSLDTVVKKMEQESKRMKLKRYEETKEYLDVSMWMEGADVDMLSKVNKTVKELNEDAKVFFLDKE